MKSKITLTSFLFAISILVSDCKKDTPPPIASFSFTGDNAPAPQEIIFTSSSTNQALAHATTDNLQIARQVTHRRQWPEMLTLTQSLYS